MCCSEVKQREEREVVMAGLMDEGTRSSKKGFTSWELCINVQPVPKTS
jgi:hypothetical protein